MLRDAPVAARLVASEEHPDHLQIDHHFRAMGCDLRIVATAPTAVRTPDGLAQAVRAAEALVHACAARLTRFDEASELCRLAADPASTVGVSPVLGYAIDLAVRTARASRGLLDPTLLAPLRTAGFGDDWNPARRVPIESLLPLAPDRAPAGRAPESRWEAIVVDRATWQVTRPVGLELDLGATAKGLIADLALRALGPIESGFVAAGGDLALHGPPTLVFAEDPFGRAPHPLTSPGSCGVATSSIAGRCWFDGRDPAHHLLNPATGRPAFTGVVQATAFAPDAARAEGLAGQALLSGPSAGRQVLQPFGGLLVLDDGSTHHITPAESR